MTEKAKPPPPPSPPPKPPQPSHVEVKEIQRLRLEPDDTLLVTLPIRMTSDAWKEVADYMAQQFPENKIIVVAEGVNVQVISKARGPKQGG